MPPCRGPQHEREALPAHDVLDRVEAEVGELGDGLADGTVAPARRR